MARQVCFILKKSMFKFKWKKIKFSLIPIYSDILNDNDQCEQNYIAILLMQNMKLNKILKI